jgi:hypothetical protein
MHLLSQVPVISHLKHQHLLLKLTSFKIPQGLFLGKNVGFDAFFERWSKRSLEIIVCANHLHNLLIRNNPHCFKCDSHRNFLEKSKLGDEGLMKNLQHKLTSKKLN